MRKGRYARLGETGSESGLDLSLSDILLFDITPADDHNAERIAIERVRMLKYAAPLTAGVHILCGIAILSAEAALSARNAAFHLLVPLAAVLLLDLAFSLIVRRRHAISRRPHLVMRATAAYVVVAGAIWSMLAASVLSDPVLAVAPVIGVALTMGLLAQVAAFATTPPLLGAGVAVGLAAAILFGFSAPVLLLAGAAGMALTAFSLFTARDMMRAAHRRFAAEWQSAKARRFVMEFEQSGRGWFWETASDGALTYVSDQLAEDLKRPADDLLGCQFTDLLSIGGDGDARDRTLGFHLSARFPFADVVVQANTEDEVRWSLSGTPIFDEYGRFLGFRGIGTDLTEQRRSEAEISRLARYDSLTGLPNRSLMRNTLEEALVNAARRKKGCSLFLIDLDRFKNVNDTLGHPVGDALLVQVAQRLAGVIGADGQVGRLGGDEFKAVLPGIDEEAHLADLAKRLIRHVSAPYVIEGATVSIGASVGICIAQPGQASADLLIRDADLALYAAKAAGRGTHCFFRPEMHAEAHDRQLLENDLRHALARGELKLLFQPSVNSVTEEVVGFEALLRWNHPVRGPISPAEFIPLAEECGLIAPIGEWVLRTACEAASHWPRGISVAVNISPIQFNNPTLPALVTSALAGAGLEPERLELEITEGVFLDDGDATDATFACLKGIGVRLALDDFGTGYSSLGYLRKAPFDKIKIDQSFVRGAAAKGSRNAAIIKAIVALAESLGMDTTAEGAETHDELTLIRQLGCSQVQGYIFGRPMPADEALELASQSKANAAACALPRFRPPRQSLIRTATLRCARDSVPVRLRNISTGGALLETERGIDPGARVWLELVGMPALTAEVRWSGGGRLGLRFEEEFDLRRLGSAPRPTALRHVPPRTTGPVEDKERLTAATLRRAG